MPTAYTANLLCQPLHGFFAKFHRTKNAIHKYAESYARKNVGYASTERERAFIDFLHPTHLKKTSLLFRSTLFRHQWCDSIRPKSMVHIYHRSSLHMHQHRKSGFLTLSESYPIANSVKYVGQLRKAILRLTFFLKSWCFFIGCCQISLVYDLLTFFSESIFNLE